MLMTCLKNENFQIVERTLSVLMNQKIFSSLFGSETMKTISIPIILPVLSEIAAKHWFE